MDPREAEFLLKYFTDLNKIDIPINVKDNSFGGRLSRLGSRIGTPVRNFINRKASIPNLLTPRSSTIPSPWGGSITSSPVVNTLGGEVVDVASSAPKSFLSRVRGRLPQGVTRFAGSNNPILKRVIKAGPIFDTAFGSVMDWGEGMSPVQAIGRNVTGTALGVPAYLAGEAVLPMVPLSGFPAYWAANEYGKEQFDRFYKGLDRDSTEPVVANLDNLPNDYQPLPTHIRENRGPEHLITGVGPKHLQPEIEQDNLSEAVDNFLTDREEWEQRTQNSPARSSGAFTDDELWALQQKHREWKAARGR
tara:strand:+ start:393 stop:1307 length:915 start_codon:yes stop_codon:yes gene_type:complete